MASTVLQGLPFESEPLTAGFVVAIIAGLTVIVLVTGTFLFKMGQIGGLPSPPNVESEERSGDSGDDGLRRGREDEEWDYY